MQLDPVLREGDHSARKALDVDQIDRADVLRVVRDQNDQSEDDNDNLSIPPSIPYRTNNSRCNNLCICPCG